MTITDIINAIMAGIFFGSCLFINFAPILLIIGMIWFVYGLLSILRRHNGQL